MVRRYATAIAFKAALEQRLRANTRGFSREIQRLRQLIVFDRFLARLAIAYGDALVVKGGVVLELRLSGARTTKDIDLRLMGRPDETLVRLQDAGQLDLGDFLTFAVRLDPRHPDINAEGMLYEGLRFRVEAALAGKVYGSAFGLDVAFAEPLAGEPELFTGRDYLSFAGIAPTKLYLYPIETHIAEKLHAYTQPRERPNSRVKDLPDMALLATIRPLDADRLRLTMQHTFVHRRTHPLPKYLPPPPTNWAPIYAQMAKLDRLAWPTIEAVFAAVQVFLDPMLRAAGGTWAPASWQWLDHSSAPKLTVS
jgi:hypothetical protein